MDATGSSSPSHFRFTLEQYLQMGELGIFRDLRVEYIDGQIFQLSPQMNRHACVVSNCLDVLSEIFPKSDYWVRSQTTLKVIGSAPEPDVAVTAGPRRGSTAFCESALLVVEVSDTTLNHDLKVKSSLYAAAGVQEYWVVDIPSRIVIVHRMTVTNRLERFGFAYSQLEKINPDQQIQPLAAPQSSVLVDRLFDSI